MSTKQKKETFRSYKVPVELFSIIHSVLILTGFSIVLSVGCYLHFYSLVKNSWWRYPDEWFPTISATIGDWYPEKNLFQITMAATSGPRLIHYAFSFIALTRMTSMFWASAISLLAFIRTLAAGVLFFVTSNDSHFIHDNSAIVYLVLTLMYMVSMMCVTKDEEQFYRRRNILLIFTVNIFPLVYFYVDHKMNNTAGAYSWYAVFQWPVVLMDAWSDYLNSKDMKGIELIINQDYEAPTTVVQSLKHASMEENTNQFILAKFFGSFSEIFIATVEGFLFWTIHTALPISIWYYPLWELGLSGYEAFLLMYLSPCLLAVGPVRRFVLGHPGLLYVLGAIGVASYPLHRLHRLILIGIATGLCNLEMAANYLANAEKANVIMISGLIASNVFRIFGYSSNLFWPFSHSEWNQVGVAIWLVISLHMTLGKKFYEIESKSTEKTNNPNWLFTAMGMGSTLFGIHSMLTDCSIILRWATEGFPNVGPEPLPWIAVVLTTMCIGHAFSVNAPRKLVSSKEWWLAGTLGAYVLYYQRGWMGLVGGLVFILYQLSVIPIIFENMSLVPLGKTLITASLMYLGLLLAHMWVVAYAFVPAGEYLRESTHIVIAMMMGGLFFGAVMNTCKETAQQQPIRNYRRFYAFILVLFGIGSYGVFWRLETRLPPVPYSNEVITAGIWNVHYAYDNDAYFCEDRVSKLLNELQLDIVGMLESDAMRIVMGNREFAQFIGERHGYYVDYGPGPSKHTWGCLLLSKYPIVESHHLLLPSPEGELACAIHAKVELPNRRLLQVVVSHNGQEETPLDRKLQAQSLGKLFRENTEEPIIYLGYITSAPHQEVYNLMFKDGNMFDIDESDSDRWCQYIAYRGIERIGYARLSRGSLSDTECQLGKFLVPSISDAISPPKYIKQTDDSRLIPQSHRFPESFIGGPKGPNDHYYHVFDKPRYFVKEN